MPYTKTTWIDRTVQRPLTFEMNKNYDGTTTLIPAEGLVTVEGTPLTAENLNNLETQYDKAMADILTMESWRNVAVENLYLHYGSTYAPASYRKAPWGQVFMRGALKSAGKLEGNIMFYLPVGYRPTHDIAVSSSDNKNNHATIIIRAGDGSATAQVSVGYDVDTQFISFDGISFWTL
jgi:hypothetical protein